jgi:hypothetical protein
VVDEGVVGLDAKGVDVAPSSLAMVASLLRR